MAASFTGETGEAPRIVTHRVRHNADAAAGTDFEEVVCTAPFAGTVSGASFIPDTTVSGNDTNLNTTVIRNATQSLTAATVTYPAASGWTALTAKAITLSGTAANLVVAAGDVITYKKTHASSGVAGPAGLIEVSFSRNDVL